LTIKTSPAQSKYRYSGKQTQVKMDLVR